MKFKEKKVNYNDINVGDIVITKSGNKRMIIKNIIGSEGYALATLEGQITTSWYNLINNLLSGIEIVKTISNDNLELIEI